MLKYAAASLVALALAAPAAAQTTTDDPGFSGIYVGAAGGYDVQPNDVGSRILFDRNLDGGFGDTVTTAAGANAFGAPNGGFCNGRATGGTSPTATSNPRPCRSDRDGWSYYARVGLDHQFDTSLFGLGGVVVGVLGEFGKSEISDSVTAFSTTPASYTMRRTVEWESSVRARAGFTPNNTTLFYGTFGPGYARIDRDFFTTNAANGFGERGKRNQWGYTGGGGIEQKLGRNFSVGLEYLFHQYEDDNYRVRAGNSGSTPANNPFLLGNAGGTDFRRTDDQFRWHSIRGTAAFRF